METATKEMLGMVDVTMRTCADCREEFEVLDPRCKAEVRCISCQVLFRKTGKTAHQRYIEELKKQQD